jgi:PIN domain nuclease of toxin-antitoxin system
VIQAKAVSLNPANYDDGLENLVVHFVVQHICLLNHESPVVRVEAALNLAKLADLLNPQNLILQGDLSLIISDIRTGHGNQNTVLNFFTLLGSRYSIMVVPIISGLECYQSYADWKIRSTCNVALSTLILEHGPEFEEQHLPAIWNFYFAMNSIPMSHKVFPDRIIIIEALEKVAPLYASKDRALSTSIVDCLLRVPLKVSYTLK